jgi:hypothetical protein
MKVLKTKVKKSKKVAKTLVITTSFPKTLTALLTDAQKTTLL